MSRSLPGFRAEPDGGPKPARHWSERGPLRLFVIDDHPIVHDGMFLLASQTPGLKVVGCACSGREALARAGRLQPDVALLDLRLPDMRGSEVAAGLRERAPGVVIVIFTAFADHPAIAAAGAAGAQAVLLKGATHAEMLALFDRIRSGEVLVMPDDLQPLGLRRPDALERVGLTRREYDVLCRVALGETNPEIAEAMHLSRNTVKSYLQTALAKLGARNRVEALAKASELGLL